MAVKFLRISNTNRFPSLRPEIEIVTGMPRVHSLELAHPTRIERVTFAFGGQRSIQLSYGCVEGSFSRLPRARQCPGAADRNDPRQPACHRPLVCGCSGQGSL